MAGDPRAAFTSLWVDHSAAVRAFAWRRCPAAMVDDVVSETFLVAWCHLGEVPPAARAWLLGVARRVIHTRLRSRDRYLALEQRVGGVPEATSRGVEEAVIDRALLVSAWQHLSEDEREALALVAWDGLDSAAAAQVLGCTRWVFRARVSRARKRLTELLAAADADAPTPPVTRYPTTHQE